MSASAIRLSFDQNIKLIELFRSHRLLWDVRNGNYFDKAARDASLAAIRTDFRAICGMDLSVEIIATKIKSLRTQYVKNLRKAEQSKRNAARADHIYKPKFVYFPYLDFLRPVLMKKSSKTDWSPSPSLRVKEEPEDDSAPCEDEQMKQLRMELMCEAEEAENWDYSTVTTERGMQVKPCYQEDFETQSSQDEAECSDTGDQDWVIDGLHASRGTDITRISAVSSPQGSTSRQSGSGSQRCGGGNLAELFTFGNQSSEQNFSSDERADEPACNSPGIKNCKRGEASIQDALDSIKTNLNVLASSVCRDHNGTKKATRDTDEVFGEFVGKFLKKIKLEHHRDEARMGIMKILTEIKSKEYEDY
ncbi:hypothetical protein BaRGS_00018363 [Batillaria attramentaria]|uniref:MADF domain-containing protein n=1 Tax=Batillaria attramentaria TaxID=370345 RepID=A0ABD0KT22_9CAEN